MRESNFYSCSICIWLRRAELQRAAGLFVFTHDDSTSRGFHGSFSRKYLLCFLPLSVFAPLSLLSANPRLASGGNAPSRGSIAARGLALIKVGPVEEAPRGRGEKGA